MSDLSDPLNRTTANTYDRVGNLTSINQPNGKSINYAYDDANRLHQKTLNGGENFIYTYDGANNLTGVTNQNNQSYCSDMYNNWYFNCKNIMTMIVAPLGIAKGMGLLTTCKTNSAQQ